MVNSNRSIKLHESFFSLWTMVTLEEQMEDLDAGLRRKSCHLLTHFGDIYWWRSNGSSKFQLWNRTFIPFQMEGSSGEIITWLIWWQFGDSFGDINYSFWRVKRRIRFFRRVTFWLARFNTRCIRVTHLISLKVNF